MKLKIFLILTIVPFSGFSADLKPFEATYNITRDGKKTGEQTTKLTQTNNNLWQIEDKIIGTNGLASMIGFSRTERTEFKLFEGKLVAMNHHMQQKAAFSKKKYAFNWDENSQQYQINHKDKTHQYSPNKHNIISAQLMPLSLALAACDHQEKLDLWVLKNKKPKNYHFTINNQNPMSAQRIYGESIKKKSITWFDDKNMCLPVKQSHTDNNDPKIETTLTKFKWL